MEISNKPPQTKFLEVSEFLWKIYEFCFDTYHLVLNRGSKGEQEVLYDSATLKV